MSSIRIIQKQGVRVRTTATVHKRSDIHHVITASPVNMRTTRYGTIRYRVFVASKQKNSPFIAPAVAVVTRHCLGRTASEASGIVSAHPHKSIAGRKVVLAEISPLHLKCHNKRLWCSTPRPSALCGPRFWWRRWSGGFCRQTALARVCRKDALAIAGNVRENGSRVGMPHLPPSFRAQRCVRGCSSSRSYHFEPRLPFVVPHGEEEKATVRHKVQGWGEGRHDVGASGRPRVANDAFPRIRHVGDLDAHLCGDSTADVFCVRVS